MPVYAMRQKAIWESRNSLGIDDCMLSLCALGANTSVGCKYPGQHTGERFVPRHLGYDSDYVVFETVSL